MVHLTNRNPNRPSDESLSVHAIPSTCRCGGRSQISVAVVRRGGRVLVQELAERCPGCGRVA
jgi:hypothetical protein